jgi:hypothetical protein
MSRLRVVLMADETVVAESEDAALWAKVMYVLGATERAAPRRPQGQLPQKSLLFWKGIGA